MDEIIEIRCVTLISLYATKFGDSGKEMIKFDKLAGNLLNFNAIFSLSLSSKQRMLYDTSTWQ